MPDATHITARLTMLSTDERPSQAAAPRAEAADNTPADTSDRPASGFGDYLETRAIQLFWAISARLPVETAGRMGGFIGRCIGRLSPRRDVVRRNLKVAFPERSAAEIERLTSSVFGNAGTVFAEYPHLGTICDPASGRVTVTADPDMPVPDPSVCLAPHIASWEVLAILPRRLGVPSMTVVYSPRNPAIDARLTAYRHSMGDGINVIPRDNSMLTLFRRLKRGGSVGLVADRRDGDGERLPFFGHPRPVSLVPAKLALKAGVPLTTAEVRRVGPGRYQMHLDKPVAVPPGLPDDDARALAMMAEVSRRYETYIRRAPGDWFCMNRLWNKKITGILQARRKA